LGAFLFAGLASPFLELQDPLHGVIGLIILLVGIRIAWKLTAETPTEVLGPFERAAAPAGPIT
jgi:cytochrome b561